MKIEPLESRIAPAGIYTYIDVDGDKVTIKTSLGSNADLAAAVTKTAGGQLQLLDLSAPIFQKTNVTISATKVAGGDGLVNVGAISAVGRDLGTVAISGDLGQITCGDGLWATTALTSLNVRSLGALGLTTQLAGGDLESIVTGPTGSLIVKTDIVGAIFYVTGSDDGTLASISVGGSIIGGTTTGSGQIQTTGNVGNVTIGGNIVGGTDVSTGLILSNGTVGNVTISGSIIGGSAQNAGAVISFGSAGMVKVAGDLIGGEGLHSGSLLFGTFTSVSVTGSVLGGPGSSSGLIQADGNGGTVTIGRDLIGQAIGSGAIVSTVGNLGAITIGGSFLGVEAESGLISAANLGAIKIGGDMIGGDASESTRITTGGRLASLTIDGSFVGGNGTLSGYITAGSIGAVKVGLDVRGGMGNESAKIQSAGNIDSITIGGSFLGNVGDYDSIPTALGQIHANGTIGAIKITGDVIGSVGDYSASIVNGEGNNATFLITSVSVGGSVIGGSGDDSALIQSAGRLGPVTIGRNLAGGSGLASGYLSANGGTFTSLTIGGSVLGGAGEDSASIFSREKMGAVSIGGDFLGGNGPGSGSLFSMLEIDKITIGGSLVGGTADSTGYLRAFGSIGSIKIGHDLLGGNLATGATDLFGSGYIESQGRIGSVTIGGSIATGIDASTAGSLFKNATIRAGFDIGSLTVTGNVTGSTSESGTTRVIIAATGQQVTTATTDLAIGKISVGGRVEWTNFLAGYDYGLNPLNADAQIGPITVSDDWIASNAVAGAINLGSDFTPGGTDEDADNVNYGTLADVKITDAGESATISSRIVSISIAGQVFGSHTGLGEADSFGFVAEQIGSLKIGARTYALTTGASNDGFQVNWRTDGIGTDAYLHEVGSDIGWDSVITDSAKLVNASTVTYLDKDGDKVTVKFSRSILTATNVNDVFTFDTGEVDDGVMAWQQLQRLDLRSVASNGLGVTITVVKGAVGDGLVNVGAIDSTGYDVGTVSIAGDLGQIDAGDTTLTTNGVASLSVRSLARYGVDTQIPISVMYVPDVRSDIEGGLGSLTVKQDISEAHVAVNGKIGAVTIGGSLIGGSAQFSGAIVSEGTIGAVKIGQHLQGGTGLGAGLIQAGSIASLTIGGSVLGGSNESTGGSFGGIIGKTDIAHNQRGGTGNNSGTLGIENGGAVTIDGSLLGGSGGFSGRLVSDGAIGVVTIGHNLVGNGARSGIVEGGSIVSVTIGGSQVGGSGTLSGVINANTVGAIKIGHDLIGGRATESGMIDSDGPLAAVTIGGSVVGGTATSTGFILSGGNSVSVKIGGNLFGGSNSYAGAIRSEGNLGPVAIGGSILGGSGSTSGYIFANGSLGAVTIAGNVIGGLGVNSGVLTADDLSIGNITLGGSLIAGANTGSGSFIATENIGIVKIGGGIIGGSASSGGSINAGQKITSLTVGDSVIGGAADYSGSVIAKNLGAISIGRNLLGGSITTGAASTTGSGYIEAGERIASLTVGGSISTGWDKSNLGNLLRNGSVRTGQDLGAVTIRGSLYGHTTEEGSSPVIISAAGAPVPTATSDLAIKSLSVTGIVDHALILAGYNVNVSAADTRLAFTNADAQIGAITVGDDWIASSLVAGVRDVDNDGFGDADDGPAGSAATISKIASITITGQVRGTAALGDHYGFTAGSIGSFKAFGIPSPLVTATALQVFELAPLTGDVSVREAYSVV